MTECLFCREIYSEANNIFFRDGGEHEGSNVTLFVARWDHFPVTPGHAELLPISHVRHFRELNKDEFTRLAQNVVQVARIISNTDLVKLYEAMLKKPVNDKAESLIRAALEKIRGFNRPPDGFNHGLNDGMAAGQTVPHVHYHLMPRWEGDVADPRGGVRNMFETGGNYLASKNE